MSEDEHKTVIIRRKIEPAKAAAPEPEPAKVQGPDPVGVEAAAPKADATPAAHAKKDDCIVFLGSHGFRGMIEEVIEKLKIKN